MMGDLLKMVCCVKSSRREQINLNEPYSSLLIFFLCENFSPLFFNKELREWITTPRKLNRFNLED